MGVGFGGDGLGEGLVDRDIAVFPSVVNAGVDGGVIGRVPHIMLQEP